MSRIEIAAELCKACELCISVCPNDCIEQSDTLNRYGVFPMRMRADARCTACTLCATICPDTAIEVYRTVEEKAPAEKTAAEIEQPAVSSELPSPAAQVNSNQEAAS